jgi:hypothetical protein
MLSTTEYTENTEENQLLAFVLWYLSRDMPHKVFNYSVSSVYSVVKFFS